MRLALPVLGMLVVAGGPWVTQAHAEPPVRGRWQLDWSAPTECPSATEVHAAVGQLLGAASARGEDTIRVRATVTPGQTWRVELETGAGDERHRRWLESTSCAELAEATALLIALMIEGNAAAAQPVTPVPAATPAKPEVPTSFRLGLLASTGLGTLPGLDVGIGGSLALLRGAWRFDLRASYGLRRDQTVVVPAPSTGYGQFNYAGATAGVCRAVGQTRVDLGACADLELGVLTAQGRGFAEGLAGQATWLGLGPGGYLAIRAGRRISFPVRATLLVPLTRPEFVYDHGDERARVYRVAPLSVRLSIAAELHF